MLCFGFVKESAAVFNRVERRSGVEVTPVSAAAP
jgi:hypothetical protein